MFELGLLFDHKPSHLNFEMHASVSEETANAQSEYQRAWLLKGTLFIGLLALKGDRRQNTPTGFRPTRF